MDNSDLTSRPYPETEAFEKGFAEFYSHHLVPKFHADMQLRADAKEELRRRRVLALSLIGTAWIAAAFLLAAIWPLESDWSRHDRRMLAGVLAAGVGGTLAAWAVANKPAAQYRAHGKLAIVKTTLSFFGSVHYEQEDLFSRQSLEETALFEPFDTIEQDDGLSGERGGRSFAVAEIALYKTGKRGETLVFSGLVLAVHMSGTVSSPVTVVPRRGLLEPLHGGATKDMVLTEVAGDHSVGSASLDQAQACLSPPVRALISRLSAAVGPGNLGLSFCGDRLFIKMRQKVDLLESLTSIRTVPSLTDVKRLVREVHDLLSLVDAVDAALDQHESASIVRS